MSSIITVWDLNQILITFPIICLVFYIMKFYWRVYQLPPGPFPFPIIGNLTSLIGDNDHYLDEIGKMGDKYGPVFTLWFAWIPIVFITDIDIGRHVFNKFEFAGQRQNHFDVLLGYDWKAGKFGAANVTIGPQWETMRRFFSSVIQKYSMSEHMLYLVSDCVDKTVKLFVEKEGINKPFICSDYLSHMMLNIFSGMLFSKRFEMNDPIIDKFNEISEKSGSKMFLWELSPVFRYIDKNHPKYKESLNNYFKLMRNEFLSHYSDYNPMITRDFSDALITAKNEEISKRKESQNILTDYNLSLSVFEVQYITSGTLQVIFEWILLYMLSLPEMHLKLREEIESQIGDRIPTHEDRNRCHYAMAFISEVFRIRNTIGLEFSHETIITDKIDKFLIPKGTLVSVFAPKILCSDKYWPMSEQFRPERFLRNGKFVTEGLKAFIPFGVGRRKCIGDKMTTYILFLCLVRFIQKTADYELVLQSSVGSKPDTNNQFLSYSPKEFKIVLNSKKH